MLNFKLILPLLFLIAPTLSWAENDSCSYPNEYTIDKRCYVTDVQKQETPYSATVAILSGDDSVRCTGTIVNGEDNNLYLYTAKHCVVDDSGVAYNEVSIKTQNGEKITVSQGRIGGANIEDEDIKIDFSEDWAIYNIPKKYNDLVASVDISNKPKITQKPLVIPYDARLIGYGALKVMSDEEIDNFKQAYMKYLSMVKDKIPEEVAGYYDGVNNFGGINIGTKYGLLFQYLLEQTKNSYFKAVFMDNSRLKESKCKYLSSGRTKNKCQAWNGNSGGGIFDNDGNIMGIFNAGNSSVGGEIHAAAVRNVILLTPLRQKVRNEFQEKAKGMFGKLR